MCSSAGNLFVGVDRLNGSTTSSIATPTATYHLVGGHAHPLSGVSPPGEGQWLCDYHRLSVFMGGGGDFEGGGGFPLMWMCWVMVVRRELTAPHGKGQRKGGAPAVRLVVAGLWQKVVCVDDSVVVDTSSGYGGD